MVSKKQSCASGNDANHETHRVRRAAGIRGQLLKRVVVLPTPAQPFLVLFNRVERSGGFTLGVLVQTNYGGLLTIDGAPIWRVLGRHPFADAGRADNDADDGSCMILVATDAPLLPHQLERLARRASLGVARTGSVSGNGSGDIFIAFSTANPGVAADTGAATVRSLANERLSPVFAATVQATEEAVVNALVAAETMVGVDGHRVGALPHARLRDVLRRYGRLRE